VIETGWHICRYEKHLMPVIEFQHGANKASCTRTTVTTDARRECVGYEETDTGLMVRGTCCICK
jgi:hypothetical protein